MKKINICIDLFEYDELSEDAKKNAFEEHLNFLVSVGYECENENGEMEQADIMLWEEQELTDYVEESLVINEYLFFKDGGTGRHNPLHRKT